MKKLRLLALGSALILSACASSTTQTRNTGIRYSILRGQGGDSWTLMIRTRQPVDALIFERQTSRFRAKEWVPMIREVRIEEHQGREIIRRADGQPFQEAMFTFRTRTELTPKDYEFFFRFTDGGLLAYTGHVYACELRYKAGSTRKAADLESEKEQRCSPPEVEIRGLPGERLVMLGKEYKERADFVEEKRKGTYVYIGRAAITRSQAMLAVVDPGLPAWVRAKFEELLPRLFDYYREKTGVELPFKPVVFLSFQAEEEGENFGAGGGTLPGLVQLQVKGKAWSEKNPKAFLRLAFVLAHEAAHLWNSQTVGYADDDMWMHEGGADAFAERALLDFGIIDQKAHLERLSEYLNECLDSLRGRVLRKVTDNPEMRPFYRCGSTIGLWTEALVSRASGGSRDLFGFWKDLFAAAGGAGGEYSEALYFSTLDKTSSDPAHSEAIHRFVDGPVSDPAAFLKDQLRNAGISLAPMPASRWPSDYQRRRGRDALRALAAQDCDGHYSLSGGKNGIRLEGSPKCRVLKNDHRITKLQGYALETEGARAYDAVRSRCAKNAGWTVRVESAWPPVILKLRCPKAPLPARAEPVEITRIIGMES
jgi:hypothetical protein